MDCLPCRLIGIRSLIRFGRNCFPLAHSVLTPDKIHTTHYLNSFRGELAISEFGWPFTPNHKSSRSFSTLVGSVLR